MIFQVNLPCNIYETIEHGTITFFPFQSQQMLQTGDVVEFRKLDSFNSYGAHYATEPGKRFDCIKIQFKLGGMMPGGYPGIDPAYTVFQLVPIDTSKEEE